MLLPVISTLKGSRNDLSKSRSKIKLNESRPVTILNILKLFPTRTKISRLNLMREQIHPMIVKYVFLRVLQKYLRLKLMDSLQCRLLKNEENVFIKNDKENALCYILDKSTHWLRKSTFMMKSVILNNPNHLEFLLLFLSVCSLSHFGSALSAKSRNLR